VAGTIGYMIIESDRDLSFLDAAYMTVITLSTVGYTEVWELSPHGRWWTILVIAFGIVTVSVAATSLVALFVSGELRSLRERKRMETTIQQLRNHVIVCGYGRVANLLVNDLEQRAIPMVVVEIKSELEEGLRDAGITYVIGDVTEEETLLNAGLMNARALVTVLPHDADNIFVTLTAHTLRPDLRIIARAEQPKTEGKLKRAGASRVICPQVLGAIRIVNVLTRPNVVDFFDVASKGVDLEMDEYIVQERSSLVGKALRDSQLRESTGAMVIAIKRADGQTLLNPSPEAVLEPQDTLILVGPGGVSSRLDQI
jgi:voltage-gated potassium channel